MIFSSSFHDLIRQPQGRPMWFHLDSLHLLYALHKAYDIAMTASRHHNDIVNRSSLRLRGIPDIRLSHDERSLTTIADSQNTSLTVTQIIPRIFPYASLNIRPVHRQTFWLVWDHSIIQTFYTCLSTKQERSCLPLTFN